jgi:hypothetical protein
MPAYIQSELDGVPPMLLPGLPGYSYGSFNEGLPTSRMLVTSVSVTTDVATLGVKMVEGNIPAVGSLITVRGTQTASDAANVTNATLTGVSINQTTGVGTVTFALTHANIATDSSPTAAGEAAVPVPEGTDVCQNGTGLQFSLQVASGLPNNSRDVEWSTETPSAPSGYTAHLQASMTDVDGDYVDIDTMTAPGTQIVNGVRANFLRGKLSGVSGGTSPTIIFKILV